MIAASRDYATLGGARRHLIKRLQLRQQVGWMTMDDREAIVRVLAKERLARLFKVPVEAVGDEAEFGRELRHSFISDFWANEFEVVDRDIRDVADAKVLSMLSSGELVIRTVGQYCDHMARCHRVNPQEVVRVLKSQLR